MSGGYAWRMAAAAGAGAFSDTVGFGREVEQVPFEVLPPAYVKALRKLLEGPLFDRCERLAEAETAALAYDRALFVARSLRLSPRRLAREPRPLFALEGELLPVEGVTSKVLSIHYCLAAGWIVARGENRPELDPFLAELEQMDACGVFLARELGYGDDIASLETEAVYRPESREFVLTSPHPRAYKLIPNLGSALPKLAVVMARLTSLGKDRGLFPFIVRVRGRDGAPCKGIRIVPLTERPAHGVTEAVTRFEGVRIPKAQLLAGSDSALRDDGSFET
jgi:acyl-CoA oxidase